MTTDSYDNIVSGLGLAVDATTDPPPGLLRHPDIEVIEETDAIIVSADIVGVEREDIRVDVSPQRLVIAATSRDPLQKRPSGMFQRSLTLPAEIRPEEAEAHYHNGVLEVFLPKKKAGGTGVFRP